RNVSSLCPQIIMKNPFSDSRQKWLRYRLATSSLFMSKSKIHSEDQLCHWCGREKETSFHFFCPIIVPVVKSVEEKIQRTYGEHLEPPDWLISTSPNYENAFQIEFIISKVQGVLYASRVKGNPLPIGLDKFVERYISLLDRIDY
ncbi:Uncharacterized protein FKW44_015723, partial [Caligus rogercresseyi]